MKSTGVKKNNKFKHLACASEGHPLRHFINVPCLKCYQFIKGAVHWGLVAAGSVVQECYCGGRVLRWLLL